ncbi:chemotaxis protein CheX [Glaciecola sp. 1036]|uniref:chemotaxis protein CheX n=1 Tax=Alteromonadaceae TaxID=72275 RepID=UPI003D074ACE
MNVEFINPFIASMQNVLSTMAMIELAPNKPKRKTSDESEGDVTGLITMRGPQTRGSLAIVFDQDLAFSIMNNMLGESVTSIDEQVKDMVGEITNMICGGAKSTLSEKGYDFEMAIPRIITGHRHTIKHDIESPVILLAFESEQGNAYLEISFNN